MNGNFEQGGLMAENYAAPSVRDLGSVEDLTQGFDKIGSVVDVLTPVLQLDGEILPD
jgi:hypothetical protein